MKYIVTITLNFLPNVNYIKFKNALLSTYSLIVTINKKGVESMYKKNYKTKQNFKYGYL